MHIKSKQNERFKAWKKLLTRKGRRELQQFIVEGEHLVEEALKSSWQVEALVYTDEYRLPASWKKEVSSAPLSYYTLESELFEELTETSTPQGIIAIIRREQKHSLTNLMEQGSTFLLLDQVNDPGNLGTIMRTAEAAHIDALIVGKGTVDPFSGKVIRATQGAIFHLPIFAVELSELVAHLQQQGWKVYGTSLDQAIDYRELQVEAEDKIALMMGNEANGVEESLLGQADQNIQIPIWGKVESLNVGIATGILLYHLQGQRRGEA